MVLSVFLSKPLGKDFLTIRLFLRGKRVVTNRTFIPCTSMLNGLPLDYVNTKHHTRRRWGKCIWQWLSQTKSLSELCRNLSFNSLMLFMLTTFNDIRFPPFFLLKGTSDECRDDVQCGGCGTYLRGNSLLSQSIKSTTHW